MDNDDTREYEQDPKIFRCAFKVIGSDSTNKQLVLLEERSFCVIALDVKDAVSKIEEDHMHIEFNGNFEGHIFHAVTTMVDVTSIRCIGTLMSISKKCLNIISEEYNRPDIRENEEYCDGEED